ncbi:STAS domain-containing protein [Winogradskyella sp.]|uniref:STAS domain-containing protein n=1 Tax=Winogradskyella sp. TaxID=1883156 RepID=UPI0026326AD3|nr:STAS domain-containing protein [Winogradskyella sp.]
MALQIKENNGVFELEGAINNATAQSFKMHVDALMLSNEQVTINIGKVNEIDVTGLSVLRELLMNSKNTNQSFYIVGYGCKEIYDDFNDMRIAS